MTQMNLSTKQKQTHRENRLVLADGEAGDGTGGNSGISRCKLIHRIDKRSSPTVYHRELSSISCDKPYEKEHICV